MHNAVAQLPLQEQQALLRIAAEDGDANVDACATRLIRRRLREQEEKLNQKLILTAALPDESAQA